LVFVDIVKLPLSGVAPIPTFFHVNLFWTDVMQEQQDILIYQTEDGVTKIQVRLTGNTVWVTQSGMVELFQSSKANISEHIKHIFEEGELKEDSVVRKFRTTAADGKNYHTSYYNLDVIISVGYRVKSLQ